MQTQTRTTGVTTIALLVLRTGELIKIPDFLSKKFQVLVVKFSIYLNRRVFIIVLLLILKKKK